MVELNSITVGTVESLIELTDSSHSPQTLINKLIEMYIENRYTNAESKVLGVDRVDYIHEIEYKDYKPTTKVDIIARKGSKVGELLNSLRVDIEEGNLNPRLARVEENYHRVVNNIIALTLVEEGVKIPLVNTLSK